MSGTFHPDQLGKGDKARLSNYTSNLAFYNGKQWPTSRRSNDKTRRLTMNYARTLIEKTAAYVMAGRTVRVLPLSDSPEVEAAALSAQDLLAQIGDANALDRLDFDTEIDTSVLGDGAFRLSWDEDESRVIITAPDVQGLFVWPKPHLLTDYLQVAHRYTLQREQAQVAFGVASAKDTATIVERWTSRDLDIWVDNTLVQTLPNPYGLIPYVIFPNSPVPKQFWGLSDIAPIREPAEELNRELSVLSTIMELSGNPIAVLSGVDSAEDIAVQAGVTWTIPVEAKAYLLDLLSGGGVSLHIEYLNAIYRALHDLSESPRTVFGDTGRQMSGVALQMEIQPMLQKVARKRLIRTEAYRRRARAALAIHDHHVGTNHTQAGPIDVNWGEVTPEDKPQDAGREVALVQAGLSAPTSSMSRLGVRDPDAELARVIDEARQLAPPAPPAPPA